MKLTGLAHCSFFLLPGLNFHDTDPTHDADATLPRWILSISSFKE